MDVAVWLRGLGLERYDQAFRENEIHRLMGDLLLRRNPSAPDRAEASYRRAIERARSQEAKSWELRAIASLARLWRDQGNRTEARGKRTEARDLLAPAYGWFTEGFDTADLKEAEALLGELS
jgi:predicted ATPase